MTEENLESVMLIVTILASVFLTLIGVLIDMSTKIKQSAIDTASKEVLLEIIVEAKNVLSFETLLSIIILLIAFVFMFIDGMLIVFSILIYGMVIWVFLNVFILLKRISFLIDEIIENM